MAFIIESDVTISFAEYSDVVEQDRRLFDSNEGLTDDVVETALIRATQRILSRIRSTDWWRNYYMKQDTSLSINSVADIPSVDPDKIKSRTADFTELCVSTALAEYVLPSVADFGSDTDTENAKRGYYQARAERLFDELVTAGDWYDFDDDGTIQSDEKEPGYFNLRRVR